MKVSVQAARSKVPKSSVMHTGFGILFIDSAAFHANRLKTTLEDCKRTGTTNDRIPAAYVCK